jgi:hypothetical protein
MRYTTHSNSKLLLVAIVLGVSQHLVSADSLPKGLTASDWTSIRAVYYAHQPQAVRVGSSYRPRNPQQQGRTETTDPIAQQAYLKASNTDTLDQFGYSVAVYGDTVVVGAWEEGSDGTGVNGDQTDNNAYGAGAAYVFVRSGTTWSQQAYLKASNTDEGDQFGYSVAISGNTIVVGANLEASNATGVNGDQTNNNATGAGAAYVFVRNGNTWSQQAYLKASNADEGDEFGDSVAISGNTVVIGAWQEASNAMGANGNQSNNSAAAAGAAYVFVRNGTTWNQQAYLKASNTDAEDQFGYSATVSGDTAVIGAWEEDSNATGINGDQTNNSLECAGAAYVFIRNGNTWSQQAYLKASNTDLDDYFGRAVALAGDTLVVGAFLESSNATGIDGNQTNNDAFHAGAAYVFVRSDTTWSQQAYLKASNTNAEDLFGYSVAVWGNTVAVGAFLEASAANGINGDQADNGASAAGAAYVFIRSGTTWSQQAYLKASNTSAGDQFGYSLALSRDAVVVGADFEASNATGVNGDQTNNRAINAGAVYVFTGLGGPPPSQPLNISTRLDVESGDNALIGGFIITGVEPKQVLLRAIGPSLGVSGVTGVLADPFLELHRPNGTVVTNDNWMDTQKQEIIDTSIPPTNDLESAIVATLDPGPYTAIVSGKNGSTGIGLVEVYDLDQAANSQLANISTRGFVNSGDNVMIGGFIVGGQSSTTVLVRGIGPSLAGLGIADPLLNPTLELHDANGAQIAFDDDWKDTQQAEIEATTIPPTDDLEAAIVMDLAPAAYTAVVRGKANTTGVGLMEVYNLQ